MPHPEVRKHLNEKRRCESGGDPQRRCCLWFDYSPGGPKRQLTNLTILYKQLPAIFGASALGMTYRMGFAPFVRPNGLEMAPLCSAML